MESVAAVVSAAAEAEARLAAQAAVETEAAVAAAARTVADAAIAAARATAVAVEAKAAVVAAAAEARRTEARLIHDALHDELTGLATRRLLVDRLTQALARSSRARTAVAVLYLDLDDFKAVNDALGHAAGDLLLVNVARRLQDRVRETDTCARVGGDEFVVVCEDLHHPSAGQVLAGRLESALTAGVPVGDRLMPVPVSVGIAVGAAGSLPLDLLEQADDAMYRAKARHAPGGARA